MIPGDGIGREVIGVALDVLDAVRAHASLDLAWDVLPWSADHYLATGETLPDGAAEQLQRDYDAILLGALGDPRVPNHAHARDILLGLRVKLDLYVNLRPVRLYDPSLCPLRTPDGTVPAIDFVVVRENTEGAYIGAGGSFRRGTEDEIAVEEAIHSRRGVERILRAAFELARREGRRRVTMADKSNAMRHSGGLWQRTFAEVRADYPEIEAEHRYVDALAMDLIIHPARYDVIVADNLFGDIVSDLGAGLQGSLGLAGSANVHPGGMAMFEPVHGSAPDIAGQGLANPMAAVLTAAMMLDHLGHADAAVALDAAVNDALNAGEVTPDLGGTLDTGAVGARLIARVGEALSPPAPPLAPAEADRAAGVR
ncbi:MAG: isocitrate/isopropylmalate dehydrogenase family protein [Acidobacteriota bacterium]